MPSVPDKHPRPAAPLLNKTGLVILILSYVIALPWLLWGEAVDLAPFLCALLFGCCLIGPSSRAFGRSSPAARIAIALLLALLIAGVAFAITGGHAGAALRHLRTQPIWLANHIFFLAFAALPLSKDIVVGLMNLVARAVRPKAP